VDGWDDERVVSFIDRFGAGLPTGPLRGRRILEPGCLDGVMTCALCHAGAEVTAFDCRAACAAKTYARCSAFGFSPRVLIHDARQIDRLVARHAPLATRYDAVFHSGVLYHLPDPAAHLRALREVADFVALHSITVEEGSARHEGFHGRWFSEPPGDHRAGAQAESFKPTRDELHRMIREAGWQCETVWERAGDDQCIGWYFLQGT
ncbi:MAG: methyltransferase domain-containing protein, partial [Pirellulales bacterium]